MSINNADDFWQVVMNAGYLMEGESRSYERQKMADLSEILHRYLTGHPDADFSMHAVARLAGAFVFNERFGQEARQASGLDDAVLAIINAASTKH
jgi:hypothetical protein